MYTRRFVRLFMHESETVNKLYVIWQNIIMCWFSNYMWVYKWFLCGVENWCINYEVVHILVVRPSCGCMVHYVASHFMCAFPCNYILLYFYSNGSSYDSSVLSAYMLERLFTCTCLAKKNRCNYSLAIDNVFTHNISRIVCAGVLGNYTMSKVNVKHHVSVKIWLL